ncbi:helix-turn-helix domain-containing protein [Pandoraea horticolens]|uniref:helix-turn-helix domain-containing protein n=1 Tax=Pandoraea horticolens TaxID=2508298 RepID=UPI0031B621BC
MHSGPGIWLIRPVARRLTLDVDFAARSRRLAIGEGQSVLIASTAGAKIVSRDGAWRFQNISLFEVAKLLAFLECCLGDEMPLPQAKCDRLIVVPTGLNARKFEAWLIGHVPDADTDAQGLFEFARAQECYWLVRFLLQEGAAAKSVAALGKRYGVSESQFRRLCCQALGRSLKRELRLWRAVRAVLNVVEGRESMVDVAMRNGFSSSSHFSREIKELFGISPVQFRRGGK